VYSLSILNSMLGQKSFVKQWDRSFNFRMFHGSRRRPAATKLNAVTAATC